MNQGRWFSGVALVVVCLAGLTIGQCGRAAEVEDVKSVITSDTFSTTGLTLPSLWWVKDQFAHKEPLAAKLLKNWQVYPGSNQQPGRIDFLVNRQFWSLLDYVERYTFLNEFGAAARGYGYNIRVLDSSEAQSVAIASYTCDFRAMAAAAPAADVTVVVPDWSTAASPVPCQITLDSAGKAGFRGRPNSSAGGTRSLDTAAP